MAPPKFADLGKAAKDLLTKDFNIGESKIEVTTKAANGAEVKKTILRPHAADAKGALATAELKYFHAPQNLSVTEKWVSANILTSTITVDKLAEGLRLETELPYNIAKGETGGLLKIDHAKDNVRTTLDLDYTKKTGNASVVVTKDNIFVGVQGIYSAEKGALQAKNAAVCYDANGFNVHILTDGEKVQATVHNKPNAQTQVAIQMSGKKGGDATNYAVAAQYNLDKDAFYKARLLDSGEAAFSYTQTLRNGVKATFGTQIDTKNLETDAHKVGIALTINL